MEAEWGIFVSKLTDIGLDNGLSPGWRQAIIWTNAGTLLVRTNFGEISREIHTFSFEKIHWKMSSAKWRQRCRGLNVLTIYTPAANEDQGAVSIRKTVLPGMAIPMLKIRRPNGRLIFNMEIAIRR